MWRCRKYRLYNSTNSMVRNHLLILDVRSAPSCLDKATKRWKGASTKQLRNISLRQRRVSAHVSPNTNVIQKYPIVWASDPDSKAPSMVPNVQLKLDKANARDMAPLDPKIFGLLRSLVCTTADAFECQPRQERTGQWRVVGNLTSELRRTSPVNVGNGTSHCNN